MTTKVLISNGGYKFHLAPLAVEMAEAHVLVGFLTAGWPSGWQKWLAERYPNSPSWRRFLDRAENIPPNLVYSVGISELLFKGGDVAIRPWSKPLQQRVHKLGFKLYARKASKVLEKVRPNIYHYRNCYGLSSVNVGRQLGAVGLCDHSIAHPVCLQWMEDQNGAWPDQKKIGEIRKTMLPLYKAMDSDLDLADHILVNSDFVKQTCVYAGMNPDTIHVIYWGVDEAFFQYLETNDVSEKVTSPDTILFAGGWQVRKGVETLIKAFEKVQTPWKLEIAGGIDAEVEAIEGMPQFLSKSEVNYLGNLPRAELAALMKRHRIMVFPSYCEGSARVIFEALAAGCYMITTPNSGSIVEDKIHGRVVPAGDVEALSEAIAYALANPALVDEIGKKNAKLVAEKYRQRDYGVHVRELYSRLQEEKSKSP